MIQFFTFAIALKPSPRVKPRYVESAPVNVAGTP